MVRLGAAGPVEDDVRGGHELDLHDAGVDRVFAGIPSGVTQTPLVADVHEVAVFELHTADVDVRLSHIGDDDAPRSRWESGPWGPVHLDEPGVEVPRAGQQDLLLQAATAAAIQERLGVLEVFVAGDDRAGDLRRRDGLAIEGGNDADLVRLHALQFERFGRHAVFGATTEVITVNRAVLIR